MHESSKDFSLTHVTHARFYIGTKLFSPAGKVVEKLKIDSLISSDGFALVLFLDVL